MTYTPLLTTDDLAVTVPSNVNENFRKRAFLNIAVMTASFTVWADDSAGSPKDLYGVASAGGNVTVTLPPVADADAAAGRVVTIFKVDAANDVIIDGDGAETINGAATITMSSQYDYRILFQAGGAWYVMGQN